MLQLRVAGPVLYRQYGDGVDESDVLEGGERVAAPRVPEREHDSPDSERGGEQ